MQDLLKRNLPHFILLFLIAVTILVWFVAFPTKIKFDANDIGQIVKNASNPAIKTAGLINATNSNDLFQVWDVTSDGSTAVDTVNNDFTFNFGAGGINTSTNTST